MAGQTVLITGGAGGIGSELARRLVARGDQVVLLGRRPEPLQALAADGTIASARGVGAVWAAGLRPEHDAVATREAMLRNGVITRAIGTDTLTFCPPLVTTGAQVDRIVETLSRSVR